jgi:hypothetical protein
LFFLKYGVVGFNRERIKVSEKGAASIGLIILKRKAQKTPSKLQHFSAKLKGVNPKKKSSQLR